MKKTILTILMILLGQSNCFAFNAEGNYFDKFWVFRCDRTHNYFGNTDLGYSYSWAFYGTSNDERWNPQKHAMIGDNFINACKFATWYPTSCVNPEVSCSKYTYGEFAVTNP